MGEGREIREGEIKWMSHFGSNVNAASFQSVNASIWKTNAIKLFQKLVCCSYFFFTSNVGKSLSWFSELSLLYRNRHMKVN